MKRKRIIALALASTLGLTSFSVVASAEEQNVTTNSNNLSYEGYTEKFKDDFNGDSLDRNNWNVELHEKGWVNSELQEYVDSADNISVKDGNLYLTPKKTVSTVEKTAGNILNNSDFSNGKEGWEETIANWGDKYTADASSSTSDGSITYSIKNPGTEDWHVQLKHPVSLEAGKTYTVTFTAESSENRQICAGIMNESYAQYGQEFPTLKKDVPQTISYNVCAPDGDDKAIFYFSLGKVNGEFVASNITISNISVVETPTAENMVPSIGFAENGTYVKDVTSEDMGANPWDLQVLQGGIKLEAGETYTVNFNASSTEPRKIVAGVQQTEDPWGQYGQLIPELTNELTTYTYTFKAETSDNNAGLYFNLGKNTDEETPESTITITDISMVKNVSEVAAAETKETVSYTSGRISTQNKQTFTYGMFECRAKVPEGQGFLPAFWLMANDENVYGQWPRCGEIDCMEVMGQEPNKLYGTIHYGNPHAESQGTYLTASDEADFSDDFHTYTCEWEPGKITWYVDGKKYHEESDWYSTTEGQGTLSYPAPFDQPFYIILNLAVGGSWVGNPDDSTSFDNNSYVIDYVRVLQKDNYDENVTKPEKEVIIRDADENGNYINNSSFSVEENLSDDEDWKFLTALGGVATATINNNEILIETKNEGTVDYSVQLVQANIPFEKGATYQVQYDAKASENRTIGVDIKAPDHGYMTYMDSKSEELTTEYETYTYEFTMKSPTDANGRLEFNMGAKDSTADIHITNVSVKKIADADPNAKDEKTVLANGNYVYNGSFQEGTNHLGYWNVETDSATYAVTSFQDGRRFMATIPAQKKLSLSQKDLTIGAGNTYELSFDIQSENDTYIMVNIGGNEYAFDVNGSQNKTTKTITLPSSLKYNNKDLIFTLIGENKIFLDNIKLVEAALLKNGSFKDGLTGYEVYIDSSAKASYVVESLKEDNALDVSIKDTGDQDWKIQVKQNNIPLEKGKTYKLTFDAKASVTREIRAIMQGNEAHGWSVYSNDNVVVLTNEFKTFTDTFTMEADTDKEAFLSICLGKVGDTTITDAHHVVIDNITFEEIISNGSEEGSNSNPSEETPDSNEETIHSLSHEVKKATTAEDGKLITKCSTCGKEISSEKIARIASVSLSEATFAYDGQSHKPTVTVKDTNGCILEETKDYEVTYPNASINAGTYKITVTFKGNYEGTKYTNYYIVAPQVQKAVTVVTTVVKAVTKTVKSIISSIFGRR